MANTLTSTIDKLRLWCSGEWKHYNLGNLKKANLTLRIHYDQLFLISQNKVLESLNLNGKIKGVYKDDVLILIICSREQVKKIKFQLKTNIEQCLYKLSLHFPVTNYNSLQSSHMSKYNNIEEVLKSALSAKGVVTGPPIPDSFNNFVKLCLLDPMFPQVLDDTQKVLSNLML